MKVICVNELEDAIAGQTIPAVGDILTVCDCRMMEGEPSYQFDEIPKVQNNHYLWFVASAFAPLDTYKEKELKEELAEIFN